MVGMSINAKVEQADKAVFFASQVFFTRPILRMGRVYKLKVCLSVCADATEVLMLLVHCCCLYVVAANALMLLMH